MNNAQLIYDIWVDGGNTEGLRNEVNYAYPWDSYQLYADLISVSPYLSDSVLIAAIENTEALPDELLTIILEANPQFQRSTEVLGELAKNRGQFTEEMLDDIISICSDSLSPLENIKANVSYYSSERNTYVNLLKQYYLADNTGTRFDSLITLLTGESDINSIYELAFIYLTKKDQQSFSDLLSITPQIILGNQEEITKWEEMQLLLPIIYFLNDSIPYESLTESNKTFIYDLAVNNDELPGMLAKAIQMQVDTSFHYNEPIYVNDDIQEARSKVNTKIINKPKNTQETINIYPNPAKDYLIVDYRNNSLAKEILIEITDMQGRLQLKKLLNVKSTQNLIDIHNFVNGLYNFTIFVDGKQKATNKIVVQN